MFRRERRPAGDDEGIVTAFRDGQVTLRSNRREGGFTNAALEIGYQGIRSGDLLTHSMDGFAGAIGGSDADGKSSPVVHTYTARSGVDARFVAHQLRVLAHTGFIASLARGIRERSTAFDVEIFRSLVLPVPPLTEQRALANFLDAECARIDRLRSMHERMLQLLEERFRRQLLDWLDGVDPTVPLKSIVTFREGPGSMAADFRDSGTPLLGIRNLVDDPAVEGAIPYTGLIILRPRAADADMGYVALFLRSPPFGQQIAVMQTGIGLQHFGPTHLSQVRLPLPTPARQAELRTRGEAADTRQHLTATTLRRQIELLQERKQALITAAVTGQLDLAREIAEAAS